MVVRMFPGIITAAGSLRDVLTGATVAGGGYILQKDFNLGVSIAAVALTRPALFRSWVP